ncbi:MAG: hypothetical protein QW424_05390 [Candidatus Bathyarchaeia archaeon]
MSTPLIGRNAVIKMGTADIGYCTGVRVTLDVDLIKAYRIGSDTPAVLTAGNKTFRVSIEKMYIDNTYATNVLNGAAVTIEVQPAGTGTGKPKITLSNVIFTSWELTIEQDGVIMESIEGEASSIAFETQ